MGELRSAPGGNLHNAHMGADSVPGEDADITRLSGLPNRKAALIDEVRKINVWPMTG